jgi:MBG domain (YGX type)/Bacterial Ig-like domain (group 3)/FG-GAP-like repeat
MKRRFRFAALWAMLTTRSRCTSALILGVLLVCVTSCAWGQSWNGFALNSSYAIPADGANSIAVGDFDGDSTLDIAIANMDSNSVTILLGNGDGTFIAAPSLATGSYPYGLVTGDFNGDGKLDLAVACNGSNSVNIFLGNGNGTFTAGTSVSVAKSPQGIAVGDFNGDGKLDLAVTTWGVSPTNNSVAILLGNGNGTFTAAASPATGSAPQGITVGDFNGDGKLDLAVANIGSNTVSILLGNGNGTFTAAASPSSGGTSPYRVAAGDFNGDGKLDLAVVNRNGGGTVAILLGNGNGTFTAGVTYAAPYAETIAVGDFNGDGKLDLAVTNEAGNSVTILLGNGNGTFTAAASPSSGGTDAWAVAAGDFNGDGFPDLAVTNLLSPATVGILLNLGPFPTTTTLAASPDPVVYGQPLTLTATIAHNGSGDASPTGTVTFYSDGTSIGTGSVSSNVASSVTSALAVGTHTLTAQYAGSSSYNGSTSSAITQIVLKATPSVTVACSPNPTTFGSSATTCTGQTNAGATGLMSITYNGTAWGSGNVNGSGAFSVSGLGGSPAGSYTIAATYAGDGNYNGGSGSTTYTINKATPTVTWATPAAISYGTALSATQLNATASVPGAFVYSPVAGTVLTAGSHTLAVTFTPTDTTDYTTASATVNLTVNQAVLTVTANNASKVYGTANPAFTPIYSGFVNGDTSAVLTGSPSLTTTATAASPVGSYTITAAAGTLSAANYSFNFVNGTLTITKATSVLSVSSSLNPSVFGNSVTFTLTVGKSGSGVVPTGTVTLTEGGTTLLPATALNGSGQATYTTSTLPAGVNTLKLTYSGDTNYF